MVLEYVVPQFFATFPHPGTGQAYEVEGWLEVLEGPGSSSGAVRDGGGGNVSTLVDLSKGDLASTAWFVNLSMGGPAAFAIVMCVMRYGSTTYTYM